MLLLLLLLLFACCASLIELRAKLLLLGWLVVPGNAGASNGRT